MKHQNNGEIYQTARGNQVSWGRARKPEETRIIPLNLVLEVYEKATSQVERSNVQSIIMGEKCANSFASFHAAVQS